MKKSKTAVKNFVIRVFNLQNIKMNSVDYLMLN